MSTEEKANEKVEAAIRAFRDQASKNIAAPHTSMGCGFSEDNVRDFIQADLWLKFNEMAEAQKKAAKAAEEKASIGIGRRPSDP